MVVVVPAQVMDAERDEDTILVVQLVFAIQMEDKKLGPPNELPNPSNLNLASKARSMHRISRRVHRHEECCRHHRADKLS